MIIQCKVNHARAATDLLIQTACEERAALVAIAEPYSILPDCVSDRSGRAPIYARGSPVLTEILVREGGYVAARWGEVVVCCCYISPNIPVACFERVLDNVSDGIARKMARRKAVTLGDFNA